MKKIYAVSYKRFKEIIKSRNINNENVNEQNTAFIQIGDVYREYQDDYDFVLKDNDNVISLRFDDCSELLEHQLVGTDEYIGQYPITSEQAKILYDFILKNKDKATFLVHCRAGQHRSAGVAKFIAEEFQVDDFQFKQMNPGVNPLFKVISELRNVKMC